MPKTRTVSVREFRENMTKFLKEAQERNVHFVVMRHAIPVAHVAPISDNELALEELAARVAKARKDIDEGRTYSTEEVLAMIDRHENRLRRNSRKRSRKASSKHRS